MIVYTLSLIFNRGIEHFYERPWISFFRRNTIALIVETLLLIIIQYIIPEHIALFYTVYSYICLLHPALLMYSWQKMLPVNSVLGQKIRLIYLGFLLLIAVIGFRNFIYQHLVIDLILVVIGFLEVYQNREKLLITLRLIYSNLTPIMKKYLLFYMIINLTNLMVFTFYL